MTRSTKSKTRKPKARRAALAVPTGSERAGRKTCAAIELARRFHALYEAYAPAFGYRTRKASSVPWWKVPMRNRRLMVAVCDQLLKENLFPNAEMRNAPSKET